MTAGTNANPVVALYNECLASEKQWNRGKLEQLKNLMIRTLAFQGPVFTAFSGKGSSSDQELAARYRLLVSFLSAAKSGDQRQQIIAQWFWAALDIPPEDVLDRAVLRRLTAKDAKRVGKLKLNDFRYAGLVQTWLPYSESLLKDVKALSEREFSTRGYDSQAVELVNRKEWQSAIEFTCEWLSRRGGIQMVKPREDPEVARTLRNAYSRVFGKSAPRCLKCIFCGELAEGEFYAQDQTSAPHCAQHSADLLPDVASAAWTDNQGRRWRRSGRTIYCESAAPQNGLSS